MDRVLDRARATLERTPAPIREVFGCWMPSKRTRRRALGRLQPETERQYVRYWKRYLCFLFRANSLTCADRGRLLGVALDAEQQRTLEIIWETLDGYLEDPDLDQWTDPGPGNPFRALLQVSSQPRRLENLLSPVSASASASMGMGGEPPPHLSPWNRSSPNAAAATTAPLPPGPTAGPSCQSGKKQRRSIDRPPHHSNGYHHSEHKHQRSPALPGSVAGSSPSPQ
jgi:hypothetical protein